ARGAGRGQGRRGVQGAIEEPRWLGRRSVVDGERGAGNARQRFSHSVQGTSDDDARVGRAYHVERGGELGEVPLGHDLRLDAGDVDVFDLGRRVVGAAVVGRRSREDVKNAEGRDALDAEVGAGHRDGRRGGEARGGDGGGVLEGRAGLEVDGGARDAEGL